MSKLSYYKLKGIKSDNTGKIEDKEGRKKKENKS